MNAIQRETRKLMRDARRPAAAFLAALAVVLIGGWSCKGPTSPEGGEADIIVVSRWEDPVDIYMDGVFKFWLSYKNSAEIDNVAREKHLMEAKSQATGEVVAQETLDITSRIDYTWTIEHRARINCDNNFSEALKVYMDRVYQFDLAQGEDRWIIGVPLGEHFLSAFKVSDGLQVLSRTVKITENKDYSWSISAITGRPPLPAGVN